MAPASDLEAKYSLPYLQVVSFETIVLRLWTRLTICHETANLLG